MQEFHIHKIWLVSNPLQLLKNNTDKVLIPKKMRIKVVIKGYFFVINTCYWTGAQRTIPFAYILSHMETSFYGLAGLASCHPNAASPKAEIKVLLR